MRKIYIIIIGFLTVLFFMAGCGGKKIKMAEKTAAEKKGIISVSVDWLKYKKKAIDAKASFINLNRDKTIIILGADIECFKGNLKGKISHRKVKRGEPIDIAPGGTYDMTIICKVDVNNEGDYKLVVRRVFENTNGDGFTRGKVLAENIEFNAKN